ncbi:hemolysin family protein [Demequina pelophila]|uniref:hemolysin family protein n=1 Tax=Demequina pelophila TaxID=1638984 RepID=UPI0007856635|nr:hemolysin family protein [Demequina pelophila]
MDQSVWLSVGLVLLFILIGGLFAGTELALVSLRESQLRQLERSGRRGARVARVARDPNRFLAAVQIGVTVAGFASAAYGASSIAPSLAPVFEGLGLGTGAAQTVALVLLTLVIAFLSLVLGELVPKRIALQRSTAVARLVGPPLDRFAMLMRPVVWLLSVSTDAVVRLLGGDPRATGEAMTEDEIRDLVTAHESLEEDERRILGDVIDAGDRSIGAVLRPRGEVAFLDAGMTVGAATRAVAERPYSRYPVIGEDVDDVVGFLHVRDLLGRGSDEPIAGLMRPIASVPVTNRVVPTLSQLRTAGSHIAVVVDEYGGTDGIVTLDEFEELTGVELPRGPYDTVGGYVVERLGALAKEGDVVPAGDHEIEVVEADARRIVAVTLAAAPASEQE